MGLAAACLGLAACTETGDFGRPKRSVWNTIVAETGTLAAASREEPVSPFGWTDDEETLRNRAWRFLTPAHEAANFQRILAELVATRVLPPDMRPVDRRAYFEALAGEDRRSPASRYRRVGEDAAADERLLGPFSRVAERVIAADRVRIGTLDHARDLSPADIDGARARVAENRCVIAWVRAALGDRIDGYRYALEHLVIETPQTEAIPVERSLAALEGSAGLLEALRIPPIAQAACLGADLPRPVARPVAPPPVVPLVRKG